MTQNHEIEWSGKGTIDFSGKDRSYICKTRINMVFVTATCLNNQGFEMSFDIGVEYMTEPSEDPDYVRAYDKYGDVLVCQQGKFSLNRHLTGVDVIGKIAEYSVYRAGHVGGDRARVFSFLKSKEDIKHSPIGFSRILFKDAVRILTKNKSPEIFDTVEINNKVYKMQTVDFEEEG